jgi:hypothetical protein
VNGYVGMYHLLSEKFPILGEMEKLVYVARAMIPNDKAVKRR